MIKYEMWLRIKFNNYGISLIKHHVQSKISKNNFYTKLSKLYTILSIDGSKNYNCCTYKLRGKCRV